MPTPEQMEIAIPEIERALSDYPKHATMQFARMQERTWPGFSRDEQLMVIGRVLSWEPQEQWMQGLEKGMTLEEIEATPGWKKSMEFEAYWDSAPEREIDSHYDWVESQDAEDDLSPVDMPLMPTPQQRESVVEQLKAIDARIRVKPASADFQATPVVVQQAVGEIWVEADWSGFTDQQRANVIERVIEGFPSNEWMAGIDAASGGYEPVREPWVLEQTSAFDRLPLKASPPHDEYLRNAIEATSPQHSQPRIPQSMEPLMPTREQIESVQRRIEDLEGERFRPVDGEMKPAGPDAPDDCLTWDQLSFEQSLEALHYGVDWSGFSVEQQVEVSLRVVDGEPSTDWMGDIAASDQAERDAALRREWREDDWARHHGRLPTPEELEKDAEEMRAAWADATAPEEYRREPIPPITSLDPLIATTEPGRETDWTSIRPLTKELITCSLLDQWPGNAAVVDFGIDSERHLGALQFAIRNDLVMPQELDAAMGNGEKLTEIARRGDNPYRDVKFETSWDRMNSAPDSPSEGGASEFREVAAAPVMSDPRDPSTPWVESKQETDERHKYLAFSGAPMPEGLSLPHLVEPSLTTDPQAIERVNRDIETLMTARFMSWEQVPFDAGSAVVPGNTGRWQEMTEFGKLDVMQHWIDWQGISQLDRASLIADQVDPEKLPPKVREQLLRDSGRAENKRNTPEPSAYDRRLQEAADHGMSLPRDPGRGRDR